jgi:acyl-CoA reductase-like NAD-dependent aldehyde dehydrogenase
VWGTVIGGRFVDAAGAPTFDVLEAATGRTMASVVAATAADVDEAVLNARSAYESHWRDVSPRARGEFMRQVAARIRGNADELGELVAREVSKSFRDALRVDITSYHTSFDYSSMPESKRTPKKNTGSLLRRAHRQRRADQAVAAGPGRVVGGGW